MDKEVFRRYRMYIEWPRFWAKPKEAKMSKQTIRIQLVQKPKTEDYKDEDGSERRRVVREEEILHNYEVFAEDAGSDEDIKFANIDKWQDKGLKPSEVEIRRGYPFR